MPVSRRLPTAAHGRLQAPVGKFRPKAEARLAQMETFSQPSPTGPVYRDRVE